MKLDVGRAATPGEVIDEAIRALARAVDTLLLAQSWLDALGEGRRVGYLGMAAVDAQATMHYLRERRPQ